MHPERNPPLTRSTPGGHAAVLTRAGIDPTPWIERCLAADAAISGAREVVDGVPAVIKAGPIAPSGGRRHGLRSLLLRAPAPAQREFQHLDWLRERLFRAPEPIAAVTIRKGLRPVRHLFASRDLGELPTIEDAFQQLAPDRRLCLARELGREVGRMHALRFLHADLYPRNVLVVADPEDGTSGHGRSLAWIDAWAGGPSAWRRGTFARLERDLGTFFSLATEWMSEDEQRAVLESYRASRSANGRPLASAARFHAAVRRERARELERLRARPARLRGRPLPRGPFYSQ